MIHICDYCNKPAKKVLGSVIYPRRTDLKDLQFWLCSDCDAYVGCHKNTNWVPLGRLADKELRAAKSEAHSYFDRLWKEGHFSRGEAYSWLSEALNIGQSLCHIGMFDVNTCKKVCELSYIKIKNMYL